MRHRVRTKKLGRTRAHRTALLCNLALSLLVHERIRTTLAKAKQAQRLIDRLITFGREGSLAARRNALQVLGDKVIVKKLFDDIAVRFKDRSSGFTRILRLGPRPSDGAEMVFLELVQRKEKVVKEKKAKKEK